MGERTHLRLGIRVPRVIGDYLILRAVRESGGFAIAVEDPAITVALDEMAREEGLLLCPEGAATYAAYKQSLADGRVKRTDQVVLFNCASGLKYPLPPDRTAHSTATSRLISRRCKRDDSSDGGANTRPPWRTHEKAACGRRGGADDRHVGRRARLPDTPDHDGRAVCGRRADRRLWRASSAEGMRPGARRSRSLIERRHRRRRHASRVAPRRRAQRPTAIR